MDQICLIMESAATANALPLEFFARVIWQESRFRPTAQGPVTRSGHRAQGIAQFMPYTADERGLLDPFNPVAALPKAAEFLRELRAEFGNLGLAAAAYNAGPGRMRQLRREAVARGLDANVWFGNVERIAAERIGRETVTYVSNIYKYYVTYLLIQGEYIQRRDIRNRRTVQD